MTTRDGRPAGHGAALDRARTLVLAHRGDARGRPENTVHALLTALAVPGCDGLEFDVRAASDGTPVLAHDETLARVFGLAERVGDLSPAELATIGVPTLREVLGAVPLRAFLDVELKEDIGAAVVPVVRAARGPEASGVVLSSFDQTAVATVRHLAPGWAAWLNVLALDAAAIAAAVALGARGVSAEVATIDATSVAAAHAAGLEVAAWTVLHPARVGELAALGVVAVCVESAVLDARAAAVVSATGDTPRRTTGAAPSRAVGSAGIEEDPG